MGEVFAWLGGAVFVTSLAYTGYFFLWVLGDANPANPHPLWQAVVVNLLLFGLFAAHHSVFARDSVKRRLVQIVPERMERTVYVWVASVMLLAVVWWWQLVQGSVYVVGGPTRWLLHAMQLAGVYLTVRAAGFIDPLELAGIRQAAAATEPVSFRTDGPFGLVRHPIYLGWILMVFGTPTMTANRAIFAVITSAYLFVAIPWEEMSLGKTFGKRYQEYKNAVRWRIIPGIW